MPYFKNYNIHSLNNPYVFQTIYQSLYTSIQSIDQTIKIKINFNYLLICQITFFLLSK